jgi:hypothetical protein
MMRITTPRTMTTPMMTAENSASVRSRSRSRPVTVVGVVRALRWSLVVLSAVVAVLLLAGLATGLISTRRRTESVQQRRVPSIAPVLRVLPASPRNRP